MRYASIWILAFVLAACSAEDWNWNLPRTNPVDPAVNNGATLPVTLPALITSNSTATLRGRIEPYTPMFNGAVAFDLDSRRRCVRPCQAQAPLRTARR